MDPGDVSSRLAHEILQSSNPAHSRSNQRGFGEVFA